ncbi:MAG: LEA type 2 family protein [Granulosicoccus sp.]
MSRKFVPYLVLALLTIGLAACSSIPTHKPIAPTVEIESIKPIKLRLNRQDLAFKLKVSNPNEYDLPLQSLSFIASVDGSQIAAGNSDERITIPAQQDAIVEVMVSTRINKLLGQLLLFSTSDQQEVDYQVEGFVKLANWPARIPFNMDGALENPGLAR